MVDSVAQERALPALLVLLELWVRIGGGKARQPIGNNAVPRQALLSRIYCAYNPGFVSLTRW